MSSSVTNRSVAELRTFIRVDRDPSDTGVSESVTTIIDLRRSCLFPAEIRAQSFRQLHRISAMLKPDDHAVADSPYVRETRLEGSTGRLCPRRVCAKSDDAVVHFKEFLRFSVPVLKVSEETREETTEHVVQSEINVAVGKTLDDFPAHVAVDNFPNNRHIHARLVKALYNSDVIVSRIFIRLSC
jgi:hypothetical protein